MKEHFGLDLLHGNDICRKAAGLAAAAIAAAVLWNVPLAGLPVDGQKCLALSAGAIILWALEVFPSGYTALALLAGYSMMLSPQAAAAGDIFGFFTKPMAYMIISGFIIAGAVKESGLAKRLSLFLISRFISDYRQVILSCYVLSYLMAVIIPQPFARAILILSVMQLLLKDSELDKRYLANIALAVFAAQNGAGMMFMTADSSLNMMILSQIPEAFRPSWWQWSVYMAVPALFTGTCMCGLQMILFGQPSSFKLDRRRAGRELEQMGRLSGREIRMVAWLVIGVSLWLTDTIHGIDAAWVSVGLALGMAMPVLGGLAGEKQLKEINLNTLLFLCASMSIGVVGTKTGMSAYLAGHLLPSDMGCSLTRLFFVTAAVCMVLHLMLGSIMAVFSLLVPALLTMLPPDLISPLAAGLLVYILTVGQWFFPYQSLSLTIGLGEGSGGYSMKMVSWFGLAYTVPSAVCGAAALLWWKAAGLL